MSLIDAIHMVPALILLAALIVGSWVLHLRLRNWPSLTFASATTAAPVVAVLLAFVQTFVVERQAATDNAQALHAMNMFMYPAAVIFGSLLLVVAVSFVLTARTVGMRPNNSFKPKPLRGSA